MVTNHPLDRPITLARRWRGTIGLCVGLALPGFAQWALVPAPLIWETTSVQPRAPDLCATLGEREVGRDLLTAQSDPPGLAFDCHAQDLLSTESSAEVEARATHDQRAATASGMRAVKRGDLETAVLRFLQVVSLAPDGPGGFQNLAAVYEAKGDHTLARWMLDAAIQKPGASCVQLLAESDLRQLTSTPGWLSHCAYLQDKRRCDNGDAAICAALLAKGAWILLTSPKTPLAHQPS